MCLLVMRFVSTCSSMRMHERVDHASRATSRHRLHTSPIAAHQSSLSEWEKKPTTKRISAAAAYLLQQCTDRALQGAQICSVEGQRASRECLSTFVALCVVSSYRTRRAARQCSWTSSLSNLYKRSSFLSQTT